jgi:hypothetical protein
MDKYYRNHAGARNQARAVPRPWGAPQRSLQLTEIPDRLERSIVVS